MPLSAAAQTLLQSIDEIRQFDANDPRLAINEMDQARQIQAEVVAARVERGEQRVGYKIGFTNRNIWPLYGVSHPIWAPMYQHTVQLLGDTEARADADRYCEPRLEPEIVVAMKATPANNSPAAIAAALDWVAHGYEIVQSVYPGWQFSGAQAQAASGLHGALFVGPRCPADTLGADPVAMLSNIQLSIHAVRDGQEQLVEQGVGANVLDGPIQAIAHLVDELARDQQQLQPGEIITTGTLTDAQPLSNGARWQSRLSQAGPLADLAITMQAGQ